MKYNIEYEKEDDGRWIAEIPSIPGVLVYGNSQEDAASKVISLALNVMSEKIEIDNFPTYLEVSYLTT
ncbi:MAG: HicB family protein [Ignavibacteria bacterium]|nr:HicB family protein [Ignavibacteria bacterium]